MSQPQLRCFDSTTQSKSKGKKKAERARWEPHVLNAFCRISASVIAEGYFQKNGTPNKTGWEMIKSQLEKETLQPWSHKQLHNKWNHVKSLFTLWKTILGETTGIGWNPLSRTIAAEDDWWASKITANPDAAELKTKKMPPWSDLQTMFEAAKDNLQQGLSSRQSLIQHDSYTHAEILSTPTRSQVHETGAQENPTQHILTPHSELAARRASNQSETPQLREAHGTTFARTSLSRHLQPREFIDWPETPLHGPNIGRSLHDVGQSGPSLVPPCMEEYALNEGNQSSKGKHARSSQNTDTRREIPQALKRSKDFLEEHSATSCAFKADTSIGTCMDIVRSLPGVKEGDAFYIDVLMLLTSDADKREALVMAVHKPEARMLYLLRIIERARKNGSL